MDGHSDGGKGGEVGARCRGDVGGTGCGVGAQYGVSLSKIIAGGSGGATNGVGGRAFGVGGAPYGVGGLSQGVTALTIGTVAGGVVRFQSIGLSFGDCEPEPQRGDELSKLVSGSYKACWD